MGTVQETRREAEGGCESDDVQHSAALGRGCNGARGHFQNMSRGSESTVGRAVSQEAVGNVCTGVKGGQSHTRLLFFNCGFKKCTL